MKEFRFAYRSDYGVYYRIIKAPTIKEAWETMYMAMAMMQDGQIHDYWIA